MLTMTFILAAAALLIALVNGTTGKPPLWIAVLLLSMIELMRLIPQG